ncbi:conserved hypothetical protein [Paraburkholderia sacchari]|uniref:T6SS immunity protein Tli3 family protein n=1 Tax=Paraburkholderia sacchari TaxID=159450 RepID=UPI0039A42C25
MESVPIFVTKWAVPLWCVMLLAGTAFWAWKRGWKWSVVKFILVLATIAAFPLLDLRNPLPRPTQVVYRFDDHRYLELTGFACEGALYFNDTKLKIRTEVVSQFYELWLKPFIHPSTRYVAIPRRDGGSFLVSNDSGRSFRNARFSTTYKEPQKEPTYDGGQDRPLYDEMKRFVVVNDQGFLELNNGRIFMSSKPIGDRWGGSYVDAIGLTHSVLAELPQFQNLPSSIPEVTNYTGWTRMRCDPDFGTTPPFNPFEYAQGVMFNIEAWTLGAPVYWGLRALGRE